MPGRVLIDTSVWIDFFRKSDANRFERVASLLREGCAVGTGVVVLELLRGSKTDQEVRLVKELFDTIHTINPTPATYFSAGELGHRMARKGRTMSVVDLLIAQLALENDHALFTLDHHFRLIADHIPLRLLEQLG